MSLPDVGDLAMVVRVCSCPSSQRLLGVVVRVESLTSLPSHCVYCGENRVLDEIAVTDVTGGFIRSWLRRIPPLHELERIPERAEA